MTGRIIAYLLDDLSPRERLEVEERLRLDPEWQREYQRLRNCLSSDESPLCGGVPSGARCELSFSGDAAEEEPLPLPKSDLVQRTCCLVQRFDQHCTRQMVPDSCAARSPSRYRLTDVAIAGGAIACVVALILPAMIRYREYARRTACQENLQFLGTALSDYADRHGRFPHVGLGQNAGIYAAVLASEGGVPPEVIARRVVCPSSCIADDAYAGRVRIALASSQASPSVKLQFADRLKLSDRLLAIGGSYAFRVGYRDSGGNYRPLSLRQLGNQPILADGPCSQSPGFRSANHGGCGQNVLYADVSVRFVSECFVRPKDFLDNQTPDIEGLSFADHLFMNYDGQPAAGWGLNDVVLLPSDYGPVGRVNVFSRWLPMKAQIFPANLTRTPSGPDR